MEGEVKQKSIEQIAREKQRLKDFVKKVLPESYDKVDVEAYFDSTLTYLENKAFLRDHLKTSFMGEYEGETMKEQKEYFESVQERMNKERDEQIEGEILEYNKKTYVENVELDEFYQPIVRAVRKICQGYSNLAFIKGRGGIGKSWNIRKEMLSNKIEFFEVTGDITEAYLYRVLLENNGKIIWFKDVVKMLRGMNSIMLLKAATETEEKRLLTKNSYSKHQDDLPSQFLFTGKIIFDYNEIAGAFLKDDFEALVTRGDFVEMAFCLEDMKRITTLVAVEDWQKEVTQFLCDNYEFTGSNLLNLRTQWKAFQTYNYASQNNLDWKNELNSELKNSISRVRAMLFSILGRKARKTAWLKKQLLIAGIVSTSRTADRRINDWLLTEDLFRASEEERNFYVSLNPVNNRTLN